MIVEIPRYEQGKFEISKAIRGNPIVQDTKKSKLRFINNIFPFHGYPVNYGAIPQTWEDPTLKVQIDQSHFLGDNDPLDVCEIGDASYQIGETKNVKIISCLAMIDDGELDWKLLAISQDHILAEKLNSPEDVQRELPGLLPQLKNWLRDYKLPMGKPQNQFGFESQGFNGWLSQEKAWEVVEECHDRWKLLAAGEIANTGDFPNISNWTQVDSPGYQSTPELIKDEKLHDTPIPESAREIFYYEK